MTFRSGLMAFLSASLLLPAGCKDEPLCDGEGCTLETASEGPVAPSSEACALLGCPEASLLQPELSTTGMLAVESCTTSASPDAPASATCPDYVNVCGGGTPAPVYRWQTLDAEGSPRAEALEALGRSYRSGSGPARRFDAFLLSSVSTEERAGCTVRREHVLKCEEGVLSEWRDCSELTRVASSTCADVPSGAWTRATYVLRYAGACPVTPAGAACGNGRAEGSEVCFGPAPTGVAPQESVAQPGALSAGDADGDGDVDLALGSQVFVNGGGSTFTASRMQGTPEADVSSVRASALARLSPVGAAGVCAAVVPSAAAPTLLRGPFSALTVTARADLASDATPRAVRAADLDQDGDLDCAALYSGGAEPSTLVLTFNDGTGAPDGAPVLQQLSTSTATSHDARDLEVANAARAPLGIFVSERGATGVSPSGLFVVTLAPTHEATVQGFFPVEGGVERLGHFDANHDEKLDVVATLSGTSALVSLAVFQGGLGPAYVQQQVPVGGSLPASDVGSADLDGDGIQDLVVAHEASDQVRVRPSTTAAWQTLQLPAGARPVRLLVTDLNADGRPDIAAYGQGLEGTREPGLYVFPSLP